MTYLVTGGAGFIGSNYLHLVVNKYKDTLFVCLDSLTYASNLESLKSLREKSNFIFIKGSICDRECLNSLFLKYKFDYVVNFAAETHVDSSLLNPSRFLETNVLGLGLLLELSNKYKVKRFHQVSTDEVYGDLPLDSTKSFDELASLRPSSPYSASKASGDLLVLAYKRTYNLPITITRSSNNYGAFQNEEKLIPLMIKKALNDEKLPIYGTGENIRDWIYVLDHSRAIDLVITKGIEGEIYNVSTNVKKTNLQIVDSILKELKNSKSVISFVEDRMGHDLKYSIDNKKIISLGLKTTNSFDSCLHKTVLWYKKHVTSA